ncbi:MAG: helix-turn-helix transcriptional regulator [Sandaracinaceae bacterium]|nr:helix-turn-helix transcriptional regulator [Sandaracinaceae bacterium]
MGAPPKTVVPVLEAAYRTELDSDAWIRAIVVALAPLIDAGVGVQGFEVRFEPGRSALGAPALAGGTDAWQRQWIENWWEPLIAAVDPETLRSMLAFGAVSSAQQLWDASARGLPTLDAHLDALAGAGWAAGLGRPGQTGRLFYVDSLNLCALDHDDAGVAIVANREEVLAPTAVRAARRRFAPVAAHLAAALRARGKLGLRAPRPDDGEAIFAPDGKLLHAEPAAQAAEDRASLAVAVRDLDRARSSSRLDDAEALALWRCLVDGRWTLLDQFDSDGRRFVVALPNAPGSTAPAFSRREAQILAELARGRSNKEIAYALGLSASTVATVVARAARKLGVESRVELVRCARALERRAKNPADSAPPDAT